MNWVLPQPHTSCDSEELQGGSVGLGQWREIWMLPLPRPAFSAEYSVAHRWQVWTCDHFIVFIDYEGVFSSLFSLFFVSDKF